MASFLRFPQDTSPPPPKAGGGLAQVRVRLSSPPPQALHSFQSTSNESQLAMRVSDAHETLLRLL